MSGPDTLLTGPAAREAWKYGDPSPLTTDRFAPLDGHAHPAGDMSLLPGCAESHRIVIWNGRLVADEPLTPRVLDAGVVLAPPAAAGATPESGAPDLPGDLIGAVNGQNSRGSLNLDLAVGAAPSQPVEIIFVTDGQARDGLVAPRLMVTAAENSRALIIERHLDLGPDPVLSVPVVDIACGPGADITHVKWMACGAEALHYGQTLVRQDAGSAYRSREFMLAGASVRRELHVRLAGEGAACDLRGLAVTDSGRRCDVRTRVHHEVPGCTTDELYKGVHRGHGHGVFDGLIRVARDAQRTRAFQTNRNLLLGDDAVSYSIPRLEIYADDVQCSHGSTTGQLGREELFYLRSRGFDVALARRMLSYAFASEVVDAVEHAGLRQELTTEVHRLLDEVQA